MTTIIGIANDHSAADHLVESIDQTGLPASDITLLMPGDSVELGEIGKAAANCAGIAGSPDGAIIGGAIGVVVGLGALSIPGFAPLVLAGSGVTGLTAVIAGGSMGILGALLGSAVPQSNITHYQQRLHNGAYLVAARAATDELATRLHAIFVSGGAEDIVICSDLPATA